MRIALIEAFGHQEIVYRWAALLADSEVVLSIYTSASIRAQAPKLLHGAGHLQWHTLPDGVDWPAFLNQVTEELNRYDLVLLLTVERQYHWFNQLDLEIPLALVVHNAHSLLCPSRFRPWRHVAHGLRAWWWGELIERQRLLHRLNALAVPTETVASHIQALDATDLPVVVLPFGYFQASPRSAAPDAPVRIVVPGTVNPAVRDYEQLRTAFLQALPKFKNPVQLTLLGLNQQPDWTAEWARSLTGGPVSLTTFEAPLDQDTYDAHLRRADFLLLPLRPHFYWTGVREDTGYSRISGGVFDALAVGRPALLPAFYPLETGWPALFTAFENTDDLARLLVEWVNDRTYQSTQERLTEKLSAYNKPAVQPRWVTGLRAILDGFLG